MDINSMGCCAIEELNYICDNNTQQDTLECFANNHYHPAEEIEEWVEDKRSRRTFPWETPIYEGKYVKTGETRPAKWTTPAFVVFSQAGEGHYADKLKELILKLSLGEVMTSPTRHNPNSGNNVTVFLWSIDRDAFHRWAIDNHIVEE